MKKIIRLTERELHNIVRESVERIINEDGEGAAMGGGATSDAGLNANGSGDPSMGVTYPFGGIMRRGFAGKTKKGKKVKNGKPFYEPALDRSPGFSVNSKK
jgi:hypothetical protein